MELFIIWNRSEPVLTFTQHPFDSEASAKQFTIVARLRD